MNRRISIGLALFGALASLAIFTSIFDPFAAAKSFVIITGAIGLMGYALLDLVQNRLFLFGKSQQIFLVLLLIFIGVFLVRTVTTSDTNSAIYGVVGRGSGFLTYLSYGLIFILSMVYVNLNNFRFLISGLLIAGFLGSFYSLLEKLGKNPWKMSQVYEGTRSLFGNPNLSGAFLSLATILSVRILKNRG